MFLTFSTIIRFFLSLRLEVVLLTVSRSCLSSQPFPVDVAVLVDDTGFEVPTGVSWIR